MSKQKNTPNFNHYNIVSDDETETVLMHYTSTRPIDQKTIDDLSAAFIAGVNLEEQIVQAQAGKFDRKAQ